MKISDRKVYELQKAILNMIAAQDEALSGMAMALLRHGEKVLAMAEFLKIKHCELRPGDEISFFGHLQGRQDLATEAGLLSGHLLMVQEQIRQSKRPASAEVRAALKRTTTILNSLPF